MASTMTWYSWHTARQDTQTQWKRLMASIMTTQGLQRQASFMPANMEESGECWQAEER